MQLKLTITKSLDGIPISSTSKIFDRRGGMIGRDEGCDWVIPDSARHLSNQHALVTYREGVYYLTDNNSRNGTFLAADRTRLQEGQAKRIEHGCVYALAHSEITAHLGHNETLDERSFGVQRPTVGTIPDDDFFGSPLEILDQRERSWSFGDVDLLDSLLDPPPLPIQQYDHAAIQTQHMPLPRLISETVKSPEAPAAAPAECQSEQFWQQFGEVLGIDLAQFNNDSREALALKAARLLKQSMAGLHQSIRTRSELKNELHLALTSVQIASSNPLKHASDSQQALRELLGDEKSGQLPAEQSIARSFRDLQAHQVALLSASRAALRGALEQFAPAQLTLRFEQSRQTSLWPGSTWRAYCRHHQTLNLDSEWSERLLARDFAQAYEEQVRLICTLQSSYPG
ncbi:type VI secretion system-associated FHA domain protein TagH [Pseudomonas sp. D47]|uniref:type VI secretion system-associated FHA domain protein TagH n=1 Tax=Pseudomonas sp. D47 TaxID=3159447 RepID=UPI00387ADAF5